MNLPPVPPSLAADDAQQLNCHRGPPDHMKSEAIGDHLERIVKRRDSTVKRSAHNRHTIGATI
jgi:hypothetical protein